MSRRKELLMKLLTTTHEIILLALSKSCFNVTLLPSLYRSMSYSNISEKLPSVVRNKNCLGTGPKKVPVILECYVWEKKWFTEYNNKTYLG